LESEIDAMFLIEENSDKFITSSNPSSDNFSSIYYWNRSFEDKKSHQYSNDHQIIESMFIGDVKLYIFKAESRDSGYEMKQFDYLLYSVRLNQRKKPMLELQFSKGRYLKHISAVIKSNPANST
jgi:hypothetical protein